MSGVLKVVAAVAGVVAVVASGGLFGAVALPAIVAQVAAGVAVVASIGSSLLAKKPQAPQTSPESIDRLNASIDPRTPRKSVVGVTAMNTDIRDQEYTNDQMYLHRFIVVAAHKVHAISEIWFDDTLAWTAAGGVQGVFVGYLTVTPVLEGNAGNAIYVSSRMGSSRRFTGLAYVYLRYMMTADGSPFRQSIPTRITIVGDGAYFYDPRLDSTVAGGSGSHRADNQATWAWSSSACRNPALTLLFYLLGWKINGLISVGLGIPKDRIDLESFITAANICDEAVAKSAGGTEPRYRCDGVWSERDDPKLVIDALKSCMNADLDDVGGKIRLTIFHNDLASPIATFTDDNILSGLKWDQTPALDSTFNVVRGVYTDPSSNSLYQQVDYPEVTTASVDNIERAETLNLPMVQSPSQAQRLAKMWLQRQLYGGTLSTTLDVTGWKVLKNDPVRVTSIALGWTNKLFRVAEIEFNTDGTVPVVLREEHADLYAWDASDAPAVVAAAPTVYQRNLDPILLAIEAAPGQVPLGQNVIVNSGFDAGLTGWTPGWDGNTGLTVARQLNMSGWSGQINVDSVMVTGTPAAGTVFDGRMTVGAGATWIERLKRWAMPVQGGERIYFSGLLAAHRCNGRIVCIYWDAAGNEISEDYSDACPQDTPNFSGGNPANATRVGAFATVPANTRYVGLEPRAFAVGGTADPYLFYSQLFLAKVAPEQTVPPPYTPGPVDRAADKTGENVSLDTWYLNGVSASTVTATINNIVSDAVLSKGEKPQLGREWNALVATKNAVYAEAVAQDVAATERANADTAVGALATYLGALTPTWNDASTDTAIVPSTFATKWADAYAAVAALQAKVTGSPGPAGAQAMVVSVSVPSANIPCSYGGTPIAGAFNNAKGAITVRFNGSDVTSSCTFSQLSQVNCVGDINTYTDELFAGAKGAYRVTSITADTAVYAMRVQYTPAGGTMQQQDVSFTLTKAKGGPGAYTKSATTVNTAIQMPNSGGNYAIDGYGNYQVSSGSGVMVAKAQYSWDGSTWFDISGSTVVGDPALPGEPSSVGTYGLLDAATAGSHDPIFLRISVAASSGSPTLISGQQRETASWA